MLREPFQIRWKWVKSNRFEIGQKLGPQGPLYGFFLDQAVKPASIPTATQDEVNFLKILLGG